MKSYDETLNYLFGLQNRGTKLGLERISSLLEIIDNPEKCFASILVAGTNGKGSVSAMISSVLCEAGFNVGLYTSPHLIDFNERIRVNGSLIEDSDIVRLTEDIREAISTDTASGGASFFEFTTALAFAYFAEREVEIAVLEVGMGGRLDATNVVNPIISIITSVGMDHTSSLGDDLASIATEKAGIIREAGLVLTASLEKAAGARIEEISAGRGAVLLREGREFASSDQEIAGEFKYRGLHTNYDSLSTALMGAHQTKNAALAVAALELLDKGGFSVDEAALRSGLKNVEWPGRCELIGSEPSVLLDCAHNEQAALALVKTLEDLSLSCERLILVLGIMSDKDIEAILALLVPLADKVIVTAPENARAMDTKELAVMVRKAALESIEIEVVPGVGAAVEVALNAAKKDDLLCVTGSVFTVGEARGYLLKSC